MINDAGTLPASPGISDQHLKAHEVSALLQSIGALALDRNFGENTGEQSGIIKRVRESRTALLKAVETAEHGNRGYEPSLLEAFDTRPIAIVTADPEYAGFLSMLFGGLQMDCAMKSDIETLVGEMSANPDDYALLIVDLDGESGTTRIIDSLLSLRQNAVTLPIVLASSNVRASDLTAERLPITDVTIRKPTSPLNIEIAVILALANNRLWRKRVSHLRQESKNCILPRRKFKRRATGGAGSASVDAQTG